MGQQTLQLTSDAKRVYLVFRDDGVETMRLEFTFTEFLKIKEMVDAIYAMHNQTRK